MDTNTDAEVLTEFIIKDDTNVPYFKVEVDLGMCDS